MSYYWQVSNDKVHANSVTLGQSRYEEAILFLPSWWSNSRVLQLRWVYRIQSGERSCLASPHLAPVCWITTPLWPQPVGWRNIIHAHNVVMIFPICRGSSIDPYFPKKCIMRTHFSDPHKRFATHQFFLNSKRTPCGRWSHCTLTDLIEIHCTFWLKVGKWQFTHISLNLGYKSLHEGQRNLMPDSIRNIVYRSVIFAYRYLVCKPTIIAWWHDFRVTTQGLGSIALD